MKRILSFLSALLLVGSFSVQAQTAPASSTLSNSSTKVTTTKTAQAPAKVSHTTTTTSKTGIASPIKVTTNARMKTNGTPDMRYKANKTTSTRSTMQAGPAKANGTPDMRYKANKTTTTTTKTQM